MDAAGWDLVVVLVIIGVRLVVPLFIPRFPLPAILVCLVVDAADQTVLQRLTDLNLDGYQSYDKALDIYYLTVAYLAVLRNWRNGMAVEVARFLWYYRLVGVLLFELSGDRWLLFVFPNSFEYFFIAIECVRLGWDPRRLSRRAVLAVAAFIWVVIKLPQEWWIHIAQLDFTEFMKETVFGVDPAEGWGAGFANRPWVLVALVAVLGGAGAVAVRAWRRRPPQDWPLGFDADRPMPPARLAGGELAQPALRWPVVEKVVLVGLITSIFSQVLGVDARVWQVTAASATIVAVNVAISELLARRGVAWRNLALQFVVLTAMNAVLVQLCAAVLGDRLNRALAWFFAYLLTMIVVLYDRYRVVREGRMAELRAAVTADRA